MAYHAKGAILVSWLSPMSWRQGGGSPFDTYKLVDTDLVVQGLLAPVSLDGQPADMGLVISVSSTFGESSSLAAEDAT